MERTKIKESLNFPSTHSSTLEQTVSLENIQLRCLLTTSITSPLVFIIPGAKNASRLEICDRDQSGICRTEATIYEDFGSNMLR